MREKNVNLKKKKKSPSLNERKGFEEINRKNYQEILYIVKGCRYRIVEGLSSDKGASVEARPQNKG